MNLNCPHCDKDHDVSDALERVDAAYKSTEFDCDFCGCVFEIGWYAEAEVRSVISTPANQQATNDKE